MSSFIEQLANEGPDSRPAAKPASVVRDTDLLDAYSQAVVQVVQSVSPAVISLSGLSDQEAAARGLLFPEKVWR